MLGLVEHTGALDPMLRCGRCVWRGFLAKGTAARFAVGGAGRIEGTAGLTLACGLRREPGLPALQRPLVRRVRKAVPERAAGVIENERAGFAGPQGAAYLLQIQGARQCRAQQDCCGDAGNVEALADQPAIAQNIEATIGQRCDQIPTLVPRRASIDMGRAPAVIAVSPRDLPRVFDVHAECDRGHTSTQPSIFGNRRSHDDGVGHQLGELIGAIIA